MTTDDRVGRFLEVEQQTAALVEELEKLRAETHHYSAAAIGLDAAVNQLATVSATLGALSGRLQEVVGALHSIGTPQLLANSQAVQEEVKGLREEVRSMREESSSLLQEIVAYQRRGFFSKLFGTGPRQHNG